MINYIFKRIYICFWIILILFSLHGLSSGASSSYYYKRGIAKFNYLIKNPKKAKYRSFWLHAASLFNKAYKKNPKGFYAPRSIYYLGRVYEELGKRSSLKKDFIRAKEFFKKVATLFPSHPWADDAKFHEAKIDLYYLKNKDEAYLNLLSIIYNYPNGDRVKDAKFLLKKLDAYYIKKVSKKSKKISIDTQIPLEKTSYSLTRKELINIRYWNSEDYSRVVLDFNGEVSFKHFLLPPNNKKPYPRIVIDLKKVFILDKLKHTIKINDGILSQIRSSRFSKNCIRVVLDITNMDNYRIFHLSDPFRIVIDIYAKEKKLNRIVIKNKNKVASSLVEQLGLDIKTIMIDPGHGGKDPGAVFGRIKEKDINLRFAKILGNLLKKKGYKVLYTRTRDVFIPLEERTAIANSKRADLFISIHVNAHKNRRVRGFEIYYLNFASSKDAIRVAARENAVSARRISDLQVILTDLMLNSKIKESASLANCVLKRVKEKSNGVREAPFYVLMGAKMPAVLIELGYITNFRDRKNLCSYSYLLRLAKEIANGVDFYRKTIRRFAKIGTTDYQ